ncbi:hypothetical protein BQ8794_200084 [Mesorhizobium prunaredense]|uniref:Uncharacterized protein n=1 Tax=Mesorhizobium prunaredense TaxID=1631249 RepID=A0A1R3V5D1_9HYPH|nr:hypothetical protein [Mesorhizobium prunaredense]SIT55081.1 hypothetical protein BQ8794_200084 [Mesorhizobium prunaredense]
MEADTPADASQKRDRGPSFPFISLEKAVERTAQFYAKAKRFEARIADAAGDWGLGPKSSGTFQTVSALLAYGLIEDSGSGEGRKIKISDAGMRILEDKRPGVREMLLSEAALKPKLLAEFATTHWKDGRPDDTHAISSLKFEHGFTDESAHKFLRVYDETKRFSNPSVSDKVSDDAGPGTEDGAKEERTKQDGGGTGKLKSPTPPKEKGIHLMDGERELTTGLLSKEASFRLIVNGRIGEKEIERLIKKLELDKEILADAEDNEGEGAFE